MGEHVKPGSVAELCELVAQAAADGSPLELAAGGSKRAIGAPDRAATRVDMTAFAGVMDYHPGELVLTVGPGTSLAEVEALVAAENQMLAFEPVDHGPLFGEAAGRATIGGVVAAAVSGSRRLSAGAVRDHLLGFEAVSGRGEAFVGGAKVVKNVTGYDLPKLMAGSWGRLAALTAITLKVLPRPAGQSTLLVSGLDDEAAVRAMAVAMGSPAEVAAAAHMPEDGVTALRLEGVAPSIAARADMLRRILGGGELVDGADSAGLWRRIALPVHFAADAVVWRVSVAPSRGPALFRELEPLGARRLYDWAGGLVWLALPIEADQSAVRQAADRAGGHATLVRAPDALRRRLSALHPEAAGVAALAARVRAAFDPAGIFSPDRFGERDAH